MPSSDQPRDVRHFIEEFALILTGAGMQRMASRTYAALLASEAGRMSARELAEALNVSPAAISGSVRYLEQVQFIRRGRDPGARTDHFAIGDDAWREAIGAEVNLMGTLVASLDRGISAVTPGSAAARHMTETRDFYAFLGDELPKLVERWAAQRTGVA